MDQIADSKHQVGRFDERLGYIYACIAGDRRYGTMINVWFDTVSCVVTITREECTPDGGMDSFGAVRNATAWRISASVTVTENDSPLTPASNGNFSKQIVKNIKHLINTEIGTVVKTYGKPSKNFIWVGGERGLSVKNCIESLRQL